MSCSMGFPTLPAGPVGHVGYAEIPLGSRIWLTSNGRLLPGTALGLRHLGSSAVSGTCCCSLFVFQMNGGKQASAGLRSARWHGPFACIPEG